MSTEGFRVVGTGINNTMPCPRETDQLVVSHIGVMLRNERQKQYAPCYDYLEIVRSLPHTNEHVNESWRRKICEWSYEVVDHFGFDRECVSIALFYLDRVIADQTRRTGKPVPKKEFQLVAVSSLYLAIKLHGETDAIEGAPRKLRITAFVELSRGMFSVEILERMERDILTTLEWYVNPPTTVSFLASFLRLLPESWDGQSLQTNVAGSVFEMARYLTELAVCVSRFAFELKPSEIAYAAILCAIDALRDTVPVPYGARLTFLTGVAEHASITPSNENVRKACGMIMELCPSLFADPPPPGGIVRSSSISSAPGDTITPSEESRNSPVCVEAVFAEEFVQRKRVRSSAT